jgi:putative serine protease PepD
MVNQPHYPPTHYPPPQPYPQFSGRYPGQPQQAAAPIAKSRNRSRGWALFGGAVAVAVVAAGIGATAAVTLQPHYATNSTFVNAPTGGQQPAASVPNGSVEQIAARVVPSVVELQTDVGRGVMEGSGVILSSDGLIMTNSHVVSAASGDQPGPGPDAPAATAARVTFADGRTAPFTVVGADPTTDIAVVRVQGVSGLTPITLGSSSNLRVGQPVVAVGSPLGLEGTVTNGIISALNRPVHAGESPNQNTFLDAIQTDAPINPGNSGGALVNMNGELIGINSAIASLGNEQGQSGSIGLGFAIPVDQAKRIADQLASSGTASHASLGVQVGNDPNTNGARIMDVSGGGPAAAAGLPSGAVVTKVDNQVITDADGLVAAVRSKAPGDKITLAYLDPSGATKSAQVTLGSEQSQQS